MRSISVGLCNPCWCRKLFINALRVSSKYCGPSSIVFCDLFDAFWCPICANACSSARYANHRHTGSRAQMSLSLVIWIYHHCLLSFYRAAHYGAFSTSFNKCIFPTHEALSWLDILTMLQVSTLIRNASCFFFFSTAHFLIKRSSLNASKCYG